MTEDKQSNEQLAVLIKGGHRELYGELWEQTKRFFYQRAMRYYRGHGERCAAAGIEVDDLEQAAFLALTDAVQAFEPSSGLMLLTYATYPLKNRFRELYGTRTAGRVTTLNGCASLDEPLPGTDDLFIGDTVPDEAAQIDYEDATDRIYNEQLHNALDRALDTLDKQQKTLLRQRYYENKTLRSIAANMDITFGRVQQIEVKALRTIRHGKGARILSDYRDEVLKCRAWHGTGWSAFIYNGASSEERAVEYLDEITMPPINAKNNAS